MLCYDRIDTSEGIDVNKTSASKECDICPYWYFFDKGFKFHDVLMMSISVKDIAILNIRGVDYCCIINGISKREVKEKNQNLVKEKKNKMRHYARERYQNLSEDEKQKLVEYRRSYYIRLNKITARSLNKVPVSIYKSR